MITKQTSRPVCKHCGLIPAKFNGKSKLGFKKWHKYCTDCSKVLYSKKLKHLKNKKARCEVCDFIPQELCQLDLCYKDGNKNNKKINNFITLCANCSRIHNKKIKKSKKSVLNVTVDTDIRIA